VAEAPAGHLWTLSRSVEYKLPKERSGTSQVGSCVTPRIFAVFSQTQRAKIVDSGFGKKEYK